MGLIKVIKNAGQDVIAEQWKEYFYCDALPQDVIAVVGRKKNSKGKLHKKGNNNIISNGSVIAISSGQCMLIVEQGKVIDFCAEPGEYIYDTSKEPSIFSGEFGDSIADAIMKLGERISFGGEAANDQRVYYFNTKEMIGNKYGTPKPLPFRVIDRNIGLDMDISIRCFGEYSYKIANPVLFFSNVCGNFTDIYTKYEIDAQLKSELLTVLQPAFAKISKLGVRYSEIAMHTEELTNAIDDELSEKWHEIRGLDVVSVGISSISANEEDEDMIKELQKTAVLRNPTMAAAHLTEAQAEAMQSAAANQSTGPAMAFMGMGMANMATGGMGINTEKLYNMSVPVPEEKEVEERNKTVHKWMCSCGTENEGKFCIECGSPKPAVEGWNCPECGTLNKGKFCMECGSKKPEKVFSYKCNKCGWEPDDPTSPPKFCPECGNIFNEEDIV